jgi:hypothetical protein
MRPDELCFSVELISVACRNLNDTIETLSWIEYIRDIFIPIWLSGMRFQFASGDESH